jgi:glycosyltransferase involved in cell wall biosynthesis
MKISVVVPCLNQFPILRQTIKFLNEARENESDYDIIILDNGSDEEFTTSIPNVRVARYEEPIGPYYSIFEALEHTDADILAFFHSDFFVYEKGWAKRVLEEFERDNRLGMVGFIGSNEIDLAGGRGYGTCGNFQGKTIIQETGTVCDVLIDGFEGGPLGLSTWSGSPIEAHGEKITGFRYGAVVDGCSMILRRTALEDIGEKENFPLMHFYDRMISTQLLEKGWKIGTLGIECDHISGQTMGEKKYIEACKKWAIEHRVQPAAIGVNWDGIIYQEAERQWLREFREQKHFIPLKVDTNGNIVR